MRSSALFSKKAVRMCVCCRERFLQEKLLRFSVLDNVIITFQGSGRSFYLCHACLNSKHATKQVLKTKNTPKNKHYIEAWLEEIQA
ncbi:putative protein [Helicobacter bizzozeronii CIII-1]|uniref:YlxR domain-containing protein n=1 Tax=Helicobacter bizzozeronii (strain CIII-1) TaxID=1002804 RepID=F8KS63_HELBC|nr:DUF448 domain-containing protein [Helicobacter bizzozeronii]CCB79617.1 putative protein [Helicobacter bizzozeronii CIII-1]